MPVHSEPAANPTADQLGGARGGSIDAVSAVSEVTRRLLTYFTSDAIQPGDRLPPERQLALTLGVGRSAVREALAALEILGVVTVRPGSGTYLRGKASELLPQTLSWGMLIGTPQTHDLIGVRHGLEVQAARLAAVLGTPEAIAEIARHLETMTDTIEGLHRRSSPPTCHTTRTSELPPRRCSCPPTSCRRPHRCSGFGWSEPFTTLTKPNAPSRSTGPCTTHSWPATATRQPQP